MNQASKSAGFLTQYRRALLAAGVLLILLWLGLKAWRVGQAAQGLLSARDQASEVMAGGLSSLDEATVTGLILDVRRDVVTLKRETAVLLPVGRWLGWLPRVGPLVSQAEPLLALADAGTEAAAYGARGLAPAIPILQDEVQTGFGRLQGLIQVAADAGPDLAQAEEALEKAAAARQRIDPQPLPGQLRELLAQTDTWLPLALDGVRVARVLPRLAGLDGARRYLIMAQNEDEMRPTGGFIAGAGLMTLEDGRLAGLSFLDANQVEGPLPYGDPPGPLREFMTLDLFFFRDANFWPDFPTSAEVAMDLYSYGQGLPPLDGAIAIDQQFMAHLVRGLGPIFIPAEEVTINGSNVIAAMREAWGIGDDESPREWVMNRKDFMGTFASAIVNKAMNDVGSIDPLYLALQLHEAATARHLQVYVRDPIVAAALRKTGWDGRLPDATGQDVLAVVDTNMGFNKVNVYVDTNTTYRVDLGQLEANLTVRYAHRGEDRGDPCFQGTPYHGSITYIERADTCYWNYVRVYAPRGSELLSASRHLIPGDSMFGGQTWDAGARTVTDEPGDLAVFANAFLLAWEQQLEMDFRYRLPPHVLQTADEVTTYRLALVKQAGARPQPLRMEITLPAGARLEAARPQPTAVTGGVIQFDVNLSTNRAFMISFRP